MLGSSSSAAAARGVVSHVYTNSHFSGTADGLVLGAHSRALGNVSRADCCWRKRLACRCTASLTPGFPRGGHDSGRFTCRSGYIPVPLQSVPLLVGPARIVKVSDVGAACARRRWRCATLHLVAPAAGSALLEFHWLVRVVALPAVGCDGPFGTPSRASSDVCPMANVRGSARGTVVLRKVHATSAPASALCVSFRLEAHASVSPYPGTHRASRIGTTTWRSQQARASPQHRARLLQAGLPSKQKGRWLRSRGRSR